MKTYAQQGDTVDSMCWRFYGRTASVVEKVYSLNKGIAEFGPILPHGTPVEMPDQVEKSVKESIRLWD